LNIKYYYWDGSNEGRNEKVIKIEYLLLGMVRSK